MEEYTFHRSYLNTTLSNNITLQIELCEKNLQKPTSAENFVTNSCNGFQSSEITLHHYGNIKTQSLFA